MPNRRDEIVKPTNQARQGVTGHHVSVVLAASTAAAAIVLGLIYYYYFGV
jgi:hypothetical protein